MTDRLCDATDCDQPSVVRSWCLPHYRRWKRFGDPNYVGRTRRAPEPKTVCSVTGCTRNGPIIRDLCPFHYRRWRTHGDPLVVKKGQHGTSSERFWRMVIKDGPIPEARPDLGPCWQWLGFHDKDGYGRLKDSRGIFTGAHRVAYEELIGPIPDGLQPDHLCRNRAVSKPVPFRAGHCT